MTTRPENKKLESEINLDDELKWGVDDGVDWWLQTSASASSAAVCRETGCSANVCREPASSANVCRESGCSADVCREEWEQPLADNEGIKPTLAEPSIAEPVSAEPVLAKPSLASTSSADEGSFPEIDINSIPYSYGYMYILECADGSFYTGSTKYIKRRLAQHQSGEGANHTSKFLPGKLIYYESFDRIDDAFYREKQVQGWSRAKKIALIKKDFDLLRLLSKNRMK